jgi:hypothetical protein
MPRTAETVSGRRVTRLAARVVYRLIFGSRPRSVGEATEEIERDLAKLTEFERRYAARLNRRMIEKTLRLRRELAEELVLGQRLRRDSLRALAAAHRGVNRGSTRLGLSTPRPRQTPRARKARSHRRRPVRGARRRPRDSDSDPPPPREWMYVNLAPRLDPSIPPRWCARRRTSRRRRSVPR